MKWTVLLEVTGWR